MNSFKYNSSKIMGSSVQLKTYSSNSYINNLHENVSSSVFHDSLKASVSYNSSQTYHKTIYLQKPLKYLLRSLMTTQEIKELENCNQNEDFDEILIKGKQYKLYRKNSNPIIIIIE